MRKLTFKIKPTSGFGHILHFGYTILLPILLLFLVNPNLFLNLIGLQVNGNFTVFAVAVVLISKWRMFAVKARHWPANVRANMVDISVGLAVVAFMANTSTAIWQLLWAVLYAVWLISIKPKTSALMIGVQAMIGQFAGLVAIYLVWGGLSTTLLTLLVGLMCYFSARHFFTAFDETYSRTAAYIWAFIGSSVAWVTAHWLIFYGFIAQPALVLTVIGYGIAGMYYLGHEDKLTPSARRQFIAVMCATIVLILVFSTWSDKTVG